MASSFMAGTVARPAREAAAIAVCVRLAGLPVLATAAAPSASGWAAAFAGCDGSGAGGPARDDAGRWRAVPIERRRAPAQSSRNEVLASTLVPSCAVIFTRMLQVAPAVPAWFQTKR